MTDKTHKKVETFNNQYTTSTSVKTLQNQGNVNGTKAQHEDNMAKVLEPV